MMGMHKSMLAIGLAGAVSAVALAQGAGIQAGQWEVAITINTMDMPGGPPKMLKLTRGKTTTVKHCITAEEASRGPQNMVKTNNACNSTRYSMTGSNFSSETICKQGSGTTTATISGSFTPTGFTATGHTVTKGGPMPMSMTNTIVGRRLGDCK